MISNYIDASPEHSKRPSSLCNQVHVRVRCIEVMKFYSKLILVPMLATVSNVNSALASPNNSAVAGLEVSATRLDLASVAANAKILRPDASNATAPKLEDSAILAQRSTAKKKPRVNRAPAKPPTRIPAPSEVQPSDSSIPTSPAESSSSGKRVLVTSIDVQSTTGAISPELKAQVLEAITSKVGQPTTSEQLQQDVNAIQALGAFQEVRTQPQQNAQGVKLTYLVTPFGNVNKVVIKTLPEGTSTALTQADTDKIFGNVYGKSLNAATLQEDIKALNKFYKDEGYDLAQVVKIENIGADGVLNIVVAEGIIEDLQVRFLNKERKPVDDKGQPVKGATRDFIITREIASRPGQVFNSKKIQQDLRRIFALGLFEDLALTLSPGTTDPAKAVVQINVIERKSGSITAGGGVSSSSGLFGSVSYQEQNLGGNGQKLGGEVQVGTRETLFDVNLTDPWIAGDPNRTSYNLNVFRRQSTSLIFDGGPNRAFVAGTFDVPRVVRSGGGITFTRPLDGNPYSDSPWRASAGVQYQRVSLQDAAGNNATSDTAGKPLTASGTGQDDLLTVQLGLSQDLRNNFAEPTQGSLLRLGLDQSVPVGSGNISMTRLRGSYTQYVPVSFINLDKGAQALVFNVQGGTIFGNAPPYEAFSLGGTTSVRGYDDGAVGSGKSYLQASAEYRFPIASIFGGTLFADYGTDLGTGNQVIGDPAGTRGKPGNGLGYGAGVRINSPLGALRLDFGFNSQGENRIQFGIGERF
jgi:outer membrane protein insertion porin family